MDKESRDKEPPAPCRLGALAPWRRLGASGPYAWRIRRPGAACKPPCVAWKPPWRPAPPGSRLGALGQHLCSSAGPYAWRRRAAALWEAPCRRLGAAGPYAWRRRAAALWEPPWRPAPPGSRLGALGQHLCSSAGPYAWRRRAAFHFCAAGRNKGGRSALLFAKPWSSTCTAPVQVLRRSAVAQQKR